MHTSGKDLDEESNLDPTQIGCIKCDHKRNSLMNDPNRGNNLTLDDPSSDSEWMVAENVAILRSIGNI